MRVVIQRVLEASVVVKGETVGAINKGLLVLLGVEASDGQVDIEWLVKKISQLRIFPGNAGNIDKSIQDIDGEIAVISQFTLYASTKKGNRPSFMNSAKPEIAKPIYESFVTQLSEKLGKKVATGIFGADMKVSLINDGPVTICMDTKNKE
ncbi:D-aminoacyl-tRNA deacylase [Aquimarina agarilytica]|uniref:D-aminoacyl-tRNA deacylase n=1 Tax=Aquimarina agarilytica TaxID=1087449 RepID=UPI0002880DC6|nr:D-aminoacyl-tRNA deacylase [Aquimarina agarilytica]